MQLAKEAGKTFKSVTFIHQLNDSFQIQLFNSSVSRCPLSHIQIYFFFIKLCVIGTAEKIRFHPPKVFATSRSIIQCYFYTESSILFTSKSSFQIFSTLLLFWVLHKTYHLRDFQWTATIIFKSILRSQSLLSLN